MSTSEFTEPHQDGSPAVATPPRARRRTRGRLPPLWVWIVVALCAGLAVWVRWTTATGDHAVVNILTLVFFDIACLAIGIWYAFFSSYPVRWRLGLTGLIVASIAVFFVIFRIDQVSGEMVPTFRLRWSPHRDARIELPPSQPSLDPDLATTTAQDFPQFLGPQRTNWVPGPALAIDWTTRPNLLWRQPIGAGWSAFAAVNGYAVTLEQRGEEEVVSCYQIESGELAWADRLQARHETILGGVGPRSTPTIFGGRVFALGPTGVLRCLDGATGKRLWQDDLLQRYGLTVEQDMQQIAWGRANSPLIVDEWVVVPVGGNPGKRVALAAYEQATGKLVWEAGTTHLSYSSPILATLAGIRQIINVNEDTVAGYSPQDGKQLWQFDWPGNTAANANASQAVPVGERQLLITKGYGSGAALWELEAGAHGELEPRQLWHEPGNLKTKFTNVVVFDGHAYGLSDGILECVELATGKRQWKKGRYGHGQILGVGDHLLVVSETGELLLVKASPERHEELARFQALEGKTWNNLCLYGNRLLLRNAEEAACYELPTEQP